MKHILYLCLAGLLFISCAEEKETTSGIYEFIPDGSSHILASPALNDFLAQAEDIPLFKENNTFNIPKLLKISALLPSGPAIVCYIPKKDTKDFLLVTDKRVSGEENDTINNPFNNVDDTGSSVISDLPVEGDTLHFSRKNGILLLSNSRNILKDALEKDEGSYAIDDNLEMVLKAADPEKTSLVINNTHPSNLIFRDATSPFSAIADWSILELNTDVQGVAYNGIATSKENSKEILQIFRDLAVQENRASIIVPSTAKGFYSFTYPAFEDLHRNLNAFRGDTLEISSEHLLHYTNEAGKIYLEEEDVHFLKTQDPQLAAEAFTTTQDPVKTYRGIEIIQYTGDTKILEFLKPLIGETTHELFAYLDNFIVFAGTTTALEEVITHYHNETTLAHRESYAAAVENLAKASSLLIVNNTAISKSFLEPRPDAEAYNLENYTYSAIQFVQENGFAHIHGVFSTTEAPQTNGLRQISSIDLEANAGTRPYLAKNHNTGQAEVVVQDENNVLYLFSGTGSLLWKKKLDSRIIGEIHQVDLFKNGNLQLAFSTQNSLEILDRNGNTVAPFPHTFKDAVTRPLAVFDYDNNKDYRFVVTQENELLMYDPSGKSVRGFRFDKTSSEIIQAPKHIRTRNRDYIVVPEQNGKLNILSRQGSARIKVNERINFSQNGWYLNQGEFISVTAAGEIIRIDEQGRIKKETVAAEGTPAITANNELLVVMTENVLKINNREITLDYGLYTAPEILETNGKTYISVTDIQAERIYIFDQNAELLPGLPVYGISAIDLQEEAGKLIFTVLGDRKTILMYSF